jgi:hypothetical protein
MLSILRRHKGYIDDNLYIGSYLHVKTEKNISYNLLCKKLGNEDLFIVVKFRGIKGQFLVPNLSDPRCQGGLNIDDAGAWDMPNPDFSHEDWKKVIKLFTEEDIEIEQKVGVVRWYS